MSKQLLMIVGVLAATFLAGVGIGYVLSNDPSRPDVITKAAGVGSEMGFFSNAAAQDREQSNTLLSNRIRELEKELADAKTDQRAILADRLALFKKFRRQINLEPFSEYLEVTPEMAALLELTPAEKKAVEGHLEEIKAELDKLQDAGTVLSKQTDNSVTYDITGDKQGDTLKDKLRAQLTADIGEDRADVFMGTNSYNYRTQLDGFLEGRKQVEISWTEQNKQRSYTVRQNLYNADGSSEGSSSMSGGGMVQPEFQKYLPEGMKP